jgi:hypothetical protein
LNSHRFNLVIRFAASAVNVSPFCWDCKGRNLFVFVKLFIFYFSEGFNTSSKNQNLNRFPLYTPFKLLSSFPSHCFPSSEAGCKSRKIISSHKQYPAFICIQVITHCFSSKKNFKVYFRHDSRHIAFRIG